MGGRGARGWRVPAAVGRAGVGLTKRYREPIEVCVSECGSVPVAFQWRGRVYRVLMMLGHWREDAAYWAGDGIAIVQRDLWRVEALGATGAGVYELACESGAWSLDRMWD